MEQQEGQVVEVGGAKVPLVLPKSFAARHDVVVESAHNPRRAAVAALGLCWGDRRSRPKARYEDDYSALAYGGRVLDELVERGIAPEDLWDAAFRAWAYVASSVVPAREVEAAEAFTGPDPADSTSRPSRSG